MPSEEAIRGFLDALAVRAEEIPAGLDGQAALYRSLLADRRMTVVLDNAASTDQVRPLLPGSATCLVVVTSRPRLSGLVALQGAHPVTLEVLPAHQARRQLASHLGAARLAAEPDAADDVVASCAGLPLALAIVAARVAARPAVTLRALAQELRATQGGLDAFTDADLTANARTAFSWSYQRLSGPAARLFRLLGLHPGTDVTVPAAASLAGLPRPEVHPAVEELCEAHLLAQHRPGRFTTHDLLRSYAAELTRGTDPDEERQVAVRRVLEHYAYTSYAGARLLNPQRLPTTLSPPSAGCVPEEFADHQQALAWFIEERAVLLAASRYAADAGHDAVLRPFAWGLTVFLQRRGHRHEWVQVQQAALLAEQRLGDRRAVADAHRHLARAYLSLRRFTDVEKHLAEALDLFRAEGDLRGEAQTLLNLGMLLDRKGRYREALVPTRRALDLFSTVGGPVMQARALNAVGWLHAQLGEHRPAVVHCRKALRILRSLGDRYGQASTLDSLGFAHQLLGEHQEAIASHRQALELRRSLGDRSTETTVLIHLGDAYLGAGNPAAARRSWRQALELADHLGLAAVDDIRVRLASLDPG
jgi:tetratricopeptide (TPR) repeat protein